MGERSIAYISIQPIQTARLCYSFLKQYLTVINKVTKSESNFWETDNFFLIFILTVSRIVAF